MCIILFLHSTHSPRHGLLSVQVSNEWPRGHEFYRILIIHECTLLHRIYRGRICSALYESPRGHDSDRISICEATWGEGGVQGSVFPRHAGEHTAWWCGVNNDAIPQWNEIGSNGMFSHYFLLRGQPELLIALFPMVRASTHFRWDPAYVVEVRSGLNKGRIEAQCSSKNKRDRTRRNYDTFKSTVQLTPEDACWTKVNPFQGERKVDSRWDKVDYEIMRQVANGSSSYETKDSSGKMKAPHWNRFFLVATLGVSTALWQNECANIDLTTRSALAESTPWECDIDLPRNNVEERLSRCSTSLSPCEQVDGIRWPLFDVVPSTAMEDNRDGRRDKCACNNEPHWVLPVYFQAHHLEPNFHFEQRGGMITWLHVTGVLTLGPGLISLLS